MPKTIYHVKLRPAERKRLIQLVSRGVSPARTILRANILLCADEGGPEAVKTEAQIAKEFHVHYQTVHTVRKEYVLLGIDCVIRRKKRLTPPIQPKITGDVEAKIIALSCSEPPAGRTKWTLRLLADKAVELLYIDAISYVSVGTLLKKTR